MVSLFVILVLVDVMETVYVQHKYPDLLTALKNIDDYKWLIVLQFFIFVGIGYVFMTRKLLYFKNDPDNNYRQFITIRQTLLKSLGEKEKKYFEKIREEKMNLNGNDNDFYTYYSYDMFNALPRNIQKKFLENYYRRIHEHKEILKTRPWDRKQITPLTKLEFHKIGIGEAITELIPDN